MGPRSQRDEQAAVLVVGGEEVDRDRLADRGPRRELELEAELPDTPLAHDADRLADRRASSTSPTSRPISSPSWKPVSSKTPRPAASTRASWSQTMKPVDGGRVVVLEQLEDEPEAAAAALERVRAAEPLEAVDVDGAVLAVGADVDGHVPIVGTGDGLASQAGRQSRVTRCSQRHTAAAHRRNDKCGRLGG